LPELFGSLTFSTTFALAVVASAMIASIPGDQKQLRSSWLLDRGCSEVVVGRLNRAGII
jgi:hypothetical protein